MSKAPSGAPPRLLPQRPFPAYAYRPGHSPHPTRDPKGHSYGHLQDRTPAPDRADWRACDDYLYGIDLFNHGFYWEAHEAWEGLWVACGRRGRLATFLQGLINLAAAGCKARWGNPRGMRANAETAHRLFRSVARETGPGEEGCLGLEPQWLAEVSFETAKAAATGPAARVTATASEKKVLPFRVILRPGEDPR